MAVTYERNNKPSGSLNHSLSRSPHGEKLTITRLIKKYPAFFMEPEGSSPFGLHKI